MTMRASLIIEARDRASAVFGRIGTRARRMGDQFRPVQQRVEAADRAIGRMGSRAIDRLRRIGTAASQAATRMQLMERAAYQTGRGIGYLIRQGATLAFESAKWAGLAATGGAIAGIAGIIAVTSKFEQFQIVLENTEGSAAAAQRSLRWVQDFAKATPFELEQVMEAYVALRAYGIDPTNGSLRTLGDTAAGMNKPVMQAVEMMADAMTGEFERLKEFGVRARVEGNRVTFSYRKNGQELTRSVRNSSAEIERALTGILSDRFGGMMERQSRTLAGIWSNLKDQASGFMLRIGQAGIFDRLKSRAEALLAKIEQLATDGTLDRWASTISTKLGEIFDWAVKFVEETDWKQVGEDLRAIGNAVWVTARGFAWAVTKAQQFKALVATIPGLDQLLNPVGASLNRIEEADAIWTRLQRQRAAGQAPGRPPQRRPDSAFSSPVPSWARPRSVPPARPAEPWLRNGRAGRPAAAARPQPVRVGGRMDLRVSMSPQLEGRLTRLESANRDVPIRASRGAVSTSS